MSMNSDIEALIVDCLVCNDVSCTALDLSSYVSLKVFEVGDECFKNVDEVKLIGLNRLERVMIGQNCFTKCGNSHGYDPNRHFYLKNCERLRELKMGRDSFSDYTVCEIENVPSLEVIEMGELNEFSSNFYHASLELKNMPSLKSLQFGGGAFYYCSRAVFENLPELTTIRFGWSAFHFKEEDESSELIMRNLPKLTTLTTSEGSFTFEYPRIITLEDMPSLTTVTLPHAFECRNQLSYK
ncbi:hypothetical protein WA577_001937, partial [Blastocystis sp. JDR]